MTVTRTSCRNSFRSKVSRSKQHVLYTANVTKFIVVIQMNPHFPTVTSSLYSFENQLLKTHVKLDNKMTLANIYIEFDLNKQTKNANK